MKSLKDYQEIYRGIAKNLNLQGDSVEMIVQMLSQATFISEVEHAAYSQEASLERATLINSKIQHCVNEMYSVFRGQCPRVILKFKSTKYFRLNVFDEVAVLNGFKVYYLGYLNTNTTETSESTDIDGTESVSGEPNFIYAPTVIPPTGDAVEYTIICLLSKSIYTQDWTLPISNTYYVDMPEQDLSSDIAVKVNGSYHSVTRTFSDHISTGALFDLTIPSFGMRLYCPDIFRTTAGSTEEQTPANTEISATVFGFSELSSYNQSELLQIKIKGAILVPYDQDFLVSGNYTESGTGLIFLSEVPRDTVTTIHYKANRDRYVNSLLRSNSDIGTVLEEMYPDKIRKSGTYYIFTPSVNSQAPGLHIYYIPFSLSNLLSTTEINQFKALRSSYYVTQDIEITRGTLYKAVYTIKAEVYQNLSIDEKVEEILNGYQYLFNMNLEGKRQEINALLSKIPNVKQITDMSITYTNDLGEVVDWETIKASLQTSYFNISYLVNSVIYSE